MTVSPVSLASPLIQEPAGRIAAAGGSSFGSMVDRVLGSAAQNHQQAESAVNDLALGRTDNLHGVLMQVAQADLSFRLILEIRNRLSEAYQDIMKMQV
jgi:flagellar hook-basal body complex protein FliE